MKHNHWIALGVPLLLGVGILTGRALAKGPPVVTPLTYGGTVADATGKPYPGPIAVTVALYTDPTGGTAVCQSPTVQAEGGTGRFSTVLPPECASAVHASSDLWSEMTVGPQNTVLPRVHVGAVPYALEADAASIAMTSKGLQCTGCVNVDAMLFDKNVSLGDHDLDAGAGSITATKLSTGPAGASLTTGQLDLGPTAGDELTSAEVKTLTGGGNADALHTHAGLGGGGQIIKFKGVTSVSFKGDAGSANGWAGAANLNNQCAKDFGAARMCSTSMLESMFPAVVPQSKSWVLVDGQWFGSGTAVLTITQGLGLGPDNNCTTQYAGAFFGTTPGWQGLALDVTGGLALTSCATSLPAACCGP